MIPNEHVLTLDLGSSSIRAAVVSTNGQSAWQVVGEAQHPYHIYRSEGHSEYFSPQDLTKRVLLCMANAVQTAEIAPTTISRIAVTAQRGGTGFLGINGDTVYVGPNTDTRAIFEGAAIDDQMRAEIYATTGHLPSMLLTPAKLHWWREHRPRRARHIATMASLGSWVVHQLTGVSGETPSTLVETGLASVATGEPAVALLTQLDVPLDALPKVFSEGSVIGFLTKEVAYASALRPGIPVALAGPDAQISALGAGAIRPGDTAIVAGWSAPVQRITITPVFDAERRTWVSRHPLDNRWVVEANPGDTGRTLETIRRMLGPRMKPERFDQLAAAAPERDLPIIAAWGPRALDMSNPGISMGGLIAPAPITYEGIDAAAIARSTLENIAFAIRECLGLLEEVDGPSKSEHTLTLAGGMAKSQVFSSILATVVGKPIRLQTTGSSAIGAALISTLAGHEISAATRDITLRSVEIIPSRTGIRDATERYQRWLHVRSVLDQLSEDI